MMGKIWCTVVCCFIAVGLAAQVPQAFNYQAVVRNAAGQVVANQAVAIRISILDAAVGGTVLYAETHRPTTNAYGLATLAVGNGSVVSGDFATITWGGSAKYLKVEIDASGGSSYIDMGTTQLLSVPYAFYAETTEPELPSGINGQTLRHDGNEWVPSSVITNTGTGIRINDGTQGNGKILISDANGNASWSKPALGQGAFKVSLTPSSFTVNFGSGYRALPFTSEDFDPDNAFSPSDSLFTAPATGIYHFEANLNFSGTVNNGAIVVRFLKNSTNTIVGQHTVRYTSATNYGESVIVSQTLSLNAGETVKLVVTGGTVEPIFNGGLGTSKSTFSGYRIR